MIDVCLIKISYTSIIVTFADYVQINRLLTDMTQLPHARRGHEAIRYDVYDD